MPSGEFLKILLAETGERTEIFRKVFNTEFYNRMITNLNNRQKEAKEKLQEQKIEFSTMVSSVNWEEKLDTKEINEVSIQQILEKLEKEIEIYTKKVSKMEKETQKEEKELQKIEGVQKEKFAMKQEVENLQKDLNDIEKELTEFLEEEKKSQKYSENLNIIKINFKKYQELKETIAFQQDRIQRLRQIAQLQIDSQKFIKEYEEKETKYRRENISYLEKEDEFFREQAGILASKLEEGQPCPVCGSMQHPKLATKSKSVLTKDELDVLKKKLDLNQKNLQTIKETITEQNSKIKTLIEELKMKADVTEEGKKLAEELNANTEELQECFEKIDFCYQEISKKKIQLEDFDFEQYQEKVNEKISEVKENITKIQVLKEQKEKELKLRIKSMETIDFEKLDAEVRVKQKTIEDKKDILLKDKMRLENNKTIEKKMQKLSHQLIHSIKEFLILEELYKTASGNLSGKSKINFEQYIQTNYFDMVVQEANKRFTVMTEGRFQLVRKENSNRISDKIALELEVLDYYNGKKRDVKSLSGGEAFKAALCLALGLSDIIQNYSGGVQVDTLFIDEGFGSLDSESREQAINTLNQLADGNKLIGIISHVTELQDRIDKKIVIEKSIEGSRIKFEV